MTHLRILFILSLFLNLTHADDPALGQIFKEADAKGTIILASLDGKTRYVWNETRSRKRFAPASTFKIPNTLIALEEGNVKNLEEEFEWDGTKHSRPAWNQRQTLRTAFQRSCVWTYQEIARRVKRPSYLRHLENLSYGNQTIGKEITNFWLDGSLRISADEQISLMRGLCNETFPYKEKSYQQLKEVMIAKTTPSYTLRAKTGWSFRVDEKVRWYVGYLEKGNTTWLFAANIDMPKWKNRLIEDEIVLQAFITKGIIKQADTK